MSFQASILSVYGPPRLFFEPLKLLNFDFNADPVPAFHSNSDQDPTFQIMRIRTRNPGCNNLIRIHIKQKRRTHRRIKVSRSTPLPSRQAACYLYAVLGIRIRRIRMFLGLPNPDPLVRGTDSDPDQAIRNLHFSQEGVERTDIMLGKYNFHTKF